jgi:membrane protease YdiL (CAAX protease family)
MKKRLFLLFLAAFLPSLAQLLAYYIGSYGFGLIVRIVFHIIIPVITVAYVSKVSLKESFVLPLQLKNKKNILLLALLCSIATIVIIVSALFIFRNFFGFKDIANSLNYNLNKQTYFFVALAIVFINPFMEEYFWRGFVFRVFDKYWTGYWTGILFSLHHSVIIFYWFSLREFLLVLVFLSIIGIFFNWLYKQTGSIYASLIIHFVADLTIVIIGWIYLF